MSKPITISLQNLNALYFKFLNQFILQHLPKDIYNDVANLLNMKSAVEAYRYLDKLLSSGEEKKENEKRAQHYQEKSNASNQGSASYLEKEDFKYQNEYQTQLTTIKKPPTLLKRTNTHQSPEEKFANINYESYNFGQARISKQDPGITKDILPLAKSPYNPNLSATTSYNVVKHDFDTVSEKNNLGEGISFRASKGKNIKEREKSDQKLSINGHKTIEFSKTYSIRQPQTKILTPPSMNNTVSGATYSQQQSNTTSIVNRLRFQNLIRQTKQIFNENSKKIARYQKISADLTLKQEKANDTFTTNFTNEGNGKNLTYIYKKY